MGAAAAVASTPGETAMFFFFSNRLGCGGSLLVSLVITAILVAIFLL
ncbi:hypothetical protein [Nocardioides zeicaulis]|uniref:Uncharacterized protein n=1 Tax=Nocardioides zeicaulis TaxID=1776857 RepID=A0ABV6E303_9ACTN